MYLVCIRLYPICQSGSPNKNSAFYNNLKVIDAAILIYIVDVQYVLQCEPY